MTLYEAKQELDKAIRNDTGRKTDCLIINECALQLIKASQEESAKRGMAEHEEHIALLKQASLEQQQGFMMERVLGFIHQRPI
jgi:hypothetical protein